MVTLAGEGSGAASASVPSKIPPEVRKQSAMLKRVSLSARAFRSWAALRSIVGAYVVVCQSPVFAPTK